jgi:hypothetical protein
VFLDQVFLVDLESRDDGTNMDEKVDQSRFLLVFALCTCVWFRVVGDSR